MSARDVQVGGSHYKGHKFQPWDIIDEYGLNFYEGSVLAYLLRRKDDRLQDLKKARHYLDKIIEDLEAAAPPEQSCDTCRHEGVDAFELPCWGCVYAGPNNFWAPKLYHTCQSCNERFELDGETTQCPKCSTHKDYYPL